MFGDLSDTILTLRYECICYNNTTAHIRYCYDDICSGTCDVALSESAGLRSDAMISIHTNSIRTISNPRTTVYVHFSMPFESSNLPGAGPKFPD